MWRRAREGGRTGAEGGKEKLANETFHHLERDDAKWNWFMLLLITAVSVVLDD